MSNTNRIFDRIFGSLYHNEIFKRCLCGIDGVEWMKTAVLIDMNANCRCSIKRAQLNEFTHMRKTCSQLFQCSLAKPQNSSIEFEIKRSECTIKKTNVNWIDISIEANWLLSLRISHNPIERSKVIQSIGILYHTWNRFAFTGKSIYIVALIFAPCRYLLCSN